VDAALSHAAGLDGFREPSPNRFIEPQGNVTLNVERRSNAGDGTLKFGQEPIPSPGEDTPAGAGHPKGASDQSLMDSQRMRVDLV
jgi:hypothetical protein